MATISITDFRQQCLSLVDRLPPDGIVITRHGQPIARLIPVLPAAPVETTEAKLARLQRWLAAQPDEPVADTRSVDEIIGYDDRGLPR